MRVLGGFAGVSWRDDNSGLQPQVINPFDSWGDSPERVKYARWGS
jgi:hypothetical protein